jgi:hypothetical protein
VSEGRLSLEQFMAQAEAYEGREPIEGSFCGRCQSRDDLERRVMFLVERWRDRSYGWERGREEAQAEGDYETAASKRASGRMLKICARMLEEVVAGKEYRL